MVVNMAADLQSELVVSLAGSRVSPELEQRLLGENRRWEGWKRQHGITQWIKTDPRAKGCQVNLVNKKVDLQGRPLSLQFQEEEDSRTSGSSKPTKRKRNKRVKRRASQPSQWMLTGDKEIKM